MIEKKSRIGRFTSSEIAALMTSDRSGKSFGKPTLTYIEEKNMERRLGRSLNTEISGKPINWGNCLEPYIFEEMLELEYSYHSDETISHPDYDFWAGSPDGSKQDSTVVDTKAPFTLKSFCQLVQPLYDGLIGMDAMSAIRENHKEGDTYYWQLVSNAILTNSKYAELIVFCPYQSELSTIRLLADGTPDYYFIWASEDKDVPYLPNNGYYKNLNVIRFEVPEEDKIALTQRVVEAGKMLIKNDIIIAHYDSDLNATIVEPEIKLSKLKKI